ncbi:MAG: hypothetical protein KAJ22_01880 [Candidatus Izimaplasma sp.]|nr:hypothetical protein [Candidatus Izimaplasma bacterium]
MTNTDNQIIKIIKRFNIKEIKKLKLFILIRLLDELKEIDNDEISHLTKILTKKLNAIDMRSHKDLKDYKKTYKSLLKAIKKKYPHITKRIISNKGVLIASSSTLGSSGSSVSSGLIGAGVAYASSLKYDDGSENKD